MASRRFLIAGNWKMNLLRDSSLQLVHALMDQLPTHPQVETAVCPPSVYLHDVGAALRGSAIGLGAQNMHAADEGAFTGEISGKMIRDLGCRYLSSVIASADSSFTKRMRSSMRRPWPHSSMDSFLSYVWARLGAARSQSDTSGRLGTDPWILANLTKSQIENTVVAYEPVWAIGTGKTATPAQAKKSIFRFANCSKNSSARMRPIKFAFSTAAA